LNKQEEIISATCLLFSVANADEILEDKEVESIKEIIIDFFQLEDYNDIKKTLDAAKEKFDNSIDIFEFSRVLNDQWDYQDKIDFICCTFEVAYSDGELHYIEENIIKKIATILNVNFQDLIKAKMEIKKYLK